MLLQNLKSGMTIKFPLSMKYSTAPKAVEECSIEALPTALTIVDGKKTVAIRVNFLPHTPGGVNYYETTGDVLSGNFTGCIMSTYEFLGKRRVAHVHTGDDAGPNTCCKDFMKDCLADNSYNSVKNFKPFDGNRDFAKVAKIAASSQYGANGCVTFGLVTSNNSIFSIYTKKIGAHEFLVDSVVNQNASQYIFA